jgi:acyl-CoA dehydrogenase
MTELHDAVDRILAGGREPAWQALSRAGFISVGLDEARGGSGGTLGDAAAVLGQAAYHCAPIPLAETTWLAGWLLAQAGQRVPAGQATAASGDLRITAGRLHGRLRRVPYAGQASEIVAVGDGFVCRVDPAACQVTAGRNLAGEERADVTVPGLAVPVIASPATPEDLLLRGALARSVQIGGAARRVLDSTVRYARQREQFGRPIAGFQAVQQQLAVLAAEVFVIDVSVRAAVRAAGTGGDRVAAAAAKCNASRAARQVARIAHQVHGAIGVTREHDLHLATTRLWSWSAEFGSARYWAARLDEWCGDRDPWAYLVDTADTADCGAAA